MRLNSSEVTVKISSQRQAVILVDQCSRRLRVNDFLAHVRNLVSIWLLALGMAGGPQAAESAPVQNGLEFFESRIRPVLAERCYECHSSTSKTPKSGLRLDFKEGMLQGGDSRKPAVVPSNPGASLLIEAIRYENHELQMPPKKRLSRAQVEDFIAWIEMGAPDPRDGVPGKTELASTTAVTNHWAYHIPVLPKTPEVVDQERAQTPIDLFVLSKLEGKGLKPSAKTDRRSFIRRATIDLTGLPPTMQEVEVFVNDPSPGALSTLIDRLLASPRYGERWGRLWLDVARYADTKGYVYSDREEGRFVHSHVYRDWVVKAFNEDLPYDVFLQLQLAADRLVSEPGDPSLSALGFLTLGRRFLGVVHDIIDDRIDVVMRGMLALTVGCARCHDHKFDPIPTQDYYSLYGVFNGAHEKLISIHSPGVNPSRSEMEFKTGLREREEKLQTTFAKKRDELLSRMRVKTTEYLVATLTADKLPNEEFYSFVGPEDLNPALIRQWVAYLFKSSKRFSPVWAPWHSLASVQSNQFLAKSPDILRSLLTQHGTNLNPLVVEALGRAELASMHDLAASYGELLTKIDQKWSLRFSTNQHVAATAPPLTEFEDELRRVLHGPDSPATLPEGAIVDLEWFFDEGTRVELGKLQSEIDKWIIKSPSAGPYAVILEDRPTQVNSRVFIRGNPATKGEEVPRQFLRVLAGSDRNPFQQGSGRLDLARAITSQDNPLTARVLVNRVWQHHFGSGLVRTTSDFGVRADPPSHPELLDWLAIHFMKEGWSIKKLHRWIMNSSVYQQVSAIETPAQSQSVAPMANRTRRTPPPNAPELVDPENRLLWRMNDRRLDFESWRDSMLFVSGELDSRLGGKSEELLKKPFSKRRTLYGLVDRQFLPGVYRLFDFANPDMHSPQRSDTTVPQQALFFMNSPFVVSQAKAIASRPEFTRITDTRKRIQSLFELVYQRRATSGEIDAAMAFIRNWDREPTTPPPKKVESIWLYGYGEYDDDEQRVKAFEKLPHFTDTAWQGGEKWPDPKLGWVQLTAEGGHAGNDIKHAAIRRWVAPSDDRVAIGGRIVHKHKNGDGIRASVVSSRTGLLGQWTVHNTNVVAKLDSVEMRQGDTIDFVVDLNRNLNNDDFSWSPEIKWIAKKSPGDDSEKMWSAKRDFGGEPPQPPPPLTTWERYAQVLLLSNEFVFVD